MNVHWLGENVQCPVVEFHDVRAEKFRSNRYLLLLLSAYFHRTRLPQYSMMNLPLRMGASAKSPSPVRDRATRKGPDCRGVRKTPLLFLIWCLDKTDTR